MGYEIIREQLVHTDRGDMDPDAVGASYYAIVYAKDAPHLGMLKVRLGVNSETVTINVDEPGEEGQEPMIPLAELRTAIDELEFTVYPDRRGRENAQIEAGAESIEDLLTQLNVAPHNDDERLDIARTLATAVLKAKQKTIEDEIEEKGPASMGCTCTPGFVDDDCPIHARSGG